MNVLHCSVTPKHRATPGISVQCVQTACQSASGVLSRRRQRGRNFEAGEWRDRQWGPYLGTYLPTLLGQYHLHSISLINESCDRASFGAILPDTGLSLACCLQHSIYHRTKMKRHLSRWGAARRMNTRWQPMYKRNGSTCYLNLPIMYYSPRTENSPASSTTGRRESRR